MELGFCHYSFDKRIQENESFCLNVTIERCLSSYGKDEYGKYTMSTQAEVLAHYEFGKYTS